MRAPELKVPYPIFAAEPFTPKEGTILVTGGGGTAASGVPNRLELYPVEFSTGQPLASVSTDDSETIKCEAPMNMSVLGNFIAVGVGNVCKIFKLGKDGGDNNPDKVRKRIQKSDDSKLEFELYTSVKVCDDPESYQNCCLLAPGNTLISGTSESHIKLYQILSANQPPRLKYTIKNAHKSDVRSLSLHNNLLASIGGDGSAFIFKLDTDSYQKLWSLRKVFGFDNNLDETKYKFQACKFFENSEKCLLVTASSPVLSRTTEPSYLSLWIFDQNGTEKMRHLNSRALNKEISATKISTRCIDTRVNKSGNAIVSIGLASGGIMVYSVPDLEPIFQYTPADLKKALFLTKVCLVGQNVVSTDAENVLRMHKLEMNYSNFGNLKYYVLTVLIVGIFILLRIFYLGKDLYSLPQIEQLESSPEYDDLNTDPVQENNIATPTVTPRDASLDF